MTDPAPATITYRLVLYRPLIFTILPILGLVGVAIVWNQLSGGVGPGPVFVVVWLSMLGWFAYWFLARIGDEVSIVDGSILRWRTVKRTREIPLSQVRGMNTPFPPFGTGSMRIVVEGHRSPLILVQAGIGDVVAMIVQFRPDLAGRVDWYGRLADRIGWPRSWGWRRITP